MGNALAKKKKVRRDHNHMVAASVTFPEKQKSESESEVWVTERGVTHEKVEKKGGKNVIDTDCYKIERRQKRAGSGEDLPLGAESCLEFADGVRRGRGEEEHRKREEGVAGRGSSPLPHTLPWKSSPLQEFSRLYPPSGMPSHFLCLPRH